MKKREKMLRPGHGGLIIFMSADEEAALMPIMAMKNLHRGHSELI